MRTRTTLAQHLPEAAARICAHYIHRVRRLVTLSGVRPTNVIAADETAMAMACEVTRTLEKRGAKSVSGMSGKMEENSDETQVPIEKAPGFRTNITTMLMFSAAGDLLKPITILDRETQPWLTPETTHGVRTCVSDFPFR